MSATVYNLYRLFCYTFIQYISGGGLCLHLWDLAFSTHNGNAYVHLIMWFVERSYVNQNDKMMQMCRNNHCKSCQLTKLNIMYQWQLGIASPVIQQKMEYPQSAVSPLFGHMSVARWELLEDWLLLSSPQVKHLRLQQKQVEAISQYKLILASSPWG